MNLKNCPVPIYGDTSFRGDCPVEAVEQTSFFAKLRREYPTTFGLIAIHPRNEGLKTGGQFRAIIKHKAEGMTPGAADIIIPGATTFICELKRRDHTKSKWEDGQLPYLEACQDMGAFACVALGAEAAWAALAVWMRMTELDRC